MRSPALIQATFAALAATALAASTALADVPFHEVHLTNAVDVADLDKFPDWLVVVFPGAPPSGRPVAWPALVEAGYQTVIDIKVLGTPKLWILPRAALEELKTAARENDDELHGPVEKLLLQKGVECATVKLEEKASFPNTVPIDAKIFHYRLEDAAPGRCQMKLVTDDFATPEEIKRAPSWASFAPRKKRADAGAPASAVSAASAAPPASGPPASASPAPSAAPSASEARAPEPAKGCACATSNEGSSRSAAIAGLLALLGIARRARRR